MAPRRIQADPLYIHSSRPLLSHQVGTSTGPTTAGRPHLTYETSYVEAPEEEDVDMEMPGLIAMGDSDDEDEDVVPSHKVVAIKKVTKRYGNSVSMDSLSNTLTTNSRTGRPSQDMDSLPRRISS